MEAEKGKRDRGERRREEKVESGCNSCHLAIRVYCNHTRPIVCTPYLFAVAVIACFDCAIYLLSSFAILVLFSEYFGPAPLFVT